MDRIVLKMRTGATRRERTRPSKTRLNDSTIDYAVHDRKIIKTLRLRQNYRTTGRGEKGEIDRREERLGEGP